MADPILLVLEYFLLFLKAVSQGSLVGGFIIFFLTLFLQGSHLFHHDTSIDHDVDHDVSLDHDVSVDHGVSLDHDVSVDHGVSLDHDVSVDHGVSLDHDVSIDHGGLELGHADLDLDADVDIDIDHDVSVGVDKDIALDHSIEADSPTPLMLLLGTFMITFGASGTFLIDAAIQGPPLTSLILIIIIIGLPFGTTFAITKIWEKMAVSDAYETALETIKIDDPVRTLTTVDTKGGLVLIETDSIHGPVKMAAKTKFGAIARNMTAYVIEIQSNTLIIDEWFSTETEKRPIPEGTIKWE